MIKTLLAMVEHTASNTAAESMPVHGSWFGVGDGTVVVWSLVWVIIPLGLLAIVGLFWAGKTGHFRNIQEIAERQIELDD